MYEDIDIGKEYTKFIATALRDCIHKFMFYLMMGLVVMIGSIMIGFTWTILECLIAVFFCVNFCFVWDMISCKSIRVGLFSDEFNEYKSKFFEWREGYVEYLENEIKKVDQSIEDPPNEDE